MSRSLPIDRMFSAFADQSRLRILHLLTRGELCVCDIHNTLKLPQSKVSRHLAYLRTSGLVKVRKAGLWKHYALAPATGKFQKGLIDCLRDGFEEVAILRHDLTALEKRLKAKACS